MLRKVKNFGVEEGKKLGIKENKIAIAKSMLEKNIPLDVICEITGLTEKELKKITLNHL